MYVAVGNHWYDYVGVDLDDDGMGDTPYTNIAGTANSKDYHPLYEDEDNVPIIIVYGPVNESYHNKSAPEFNI